MDRSIWTLPGPGSLVREVNSEHQQGRHVAVVLPEFLTADENFTYGLAAAVVAELSRTYDAVQVEPYGTGESLAAVVGRAFSYEDPPVTVPDLLRHPDAIGHTAVLVGSQLPSELRAQVPDFLRRAARESQSISADCRLSVVAVVGRSQLPAFAGHMQSDVKLATVWWWGRLARWDTAAHLNRTSGENLGVYGSHLLDDVRTETIVEIARWDLDLATELAEHWDGEVAALKELLALRDSGIRCDHVSGACGPTPPPTAVDAWDRGLVDSWHGELSMSVRLPQPDSVFSRTVWAAQARAILPWIDLHRARLESLVIKTMGRDRFDAAVKDLIASEVEPDGVIEIAQLHKIINVRLGSSSRLGMAASQLHRARNELAHLRPLSWNAIRRMGATCAELIGQ